MSYAKGTAVGEDRSRAEIEKMLQKVGASRFGVLTDFERRTATIGFTYQNIQIEMRIPLPDPNDSAFKLTPSGRWSKSTDDQAKAYQGEVRRRWRCLVMALKAKLVAVSDGIATFEREFLPYMVTADGTTVGERFAPIIEHAKRSGVISPMLALPEGSTA